MRRAPQLAGYGASSFKNNHMICVVLDGFHSGHVVKLEAHVKVLKLYKPKAITVDLCCDGSS